MRAHLVTLLCTLWAGAALAYGLGEATDPRLARIAERASGYLLKARLPGGGWVWERTGGQVGDNYGGIVAESLLAAHEQSGEAIYLAAARDYADGLVKKFRARPDVLPYKPDIELLVRLTEVTGETSYGEVARAWFAVVERILRGRARRSDLVGYDVALGIRAALAVEQVDYARGLADAVMVRREAWLRAPGKSFGTISRAALLDALVTLDARRFAAPITELSRALVREQGRNGAWCVNETQATAYAVRALSRSADPAARTAARRGGAWLAQTLLDDGSWAHFNDGLPPPFVGEHISAVQAEALTAVVLASKI